MLKTRVIPSVSEGPVWAGGTSRYVPARIRMNPAPNAHSPCPQHPTAMTPKASQTVAPGKRSRKAGERHPGLTSEQSAPGNEVRKRHFTSIVILSREDAEGPENERTITDRRDSLTTTHARLIANQTLNP
jgi:hypothetical protein